MKTAISIRDDIFKEVEVFAKEHHCSRSDVFSMATTEFLEKIKSQKLLNALNEAYSGAESAEETELRKAGEKRYAKTVLKERY